MMDYDVIVIGGGSAGTSAAGAASRAGARTLVINEGELGGLCILRGCMPTKAMLASAHALHETRHLDRFGLRLEGTVSADFDRIMHRKDEQVRRFQRAKIESVEGQSYEVLFGRARFDEEARLTVGEQKFDADRYVIASGSVPRVPSIPGIDSVPVLTSDDVMRLERRPDSLVVLGAGPIGLELAQFFARIGTRVLLVNRSPLLCHYDVEAGKELRAALEDEAGLELVVPGRILRVEATSSGVRVTMRSGEREWSHEASALLAATGRRPALDDLGLEHVNLRPGPEGLWCDRTMRTRNPRIFVAGDATGNYQVLHLANQEGTVAGHNAARDTPALEMDYRLKMAVIFTDPPFAAVGATETELDADGAEYVTGRARFPETGRAITMGTRHGLWKLRADPGSGEVLGSTILGPRADDLIHIVSTTMSLRGNVEALCGMPWYHPTLSEVILNVARDITRQRNAECSIPGAATLPPGYSSTMHEQPEE